MSKQKGNKRELVMSLPEQCFWVNNGPILSDLKELHSALKHEVSKEQFLHHTQNGNNDFANWVEQTLHDESCAKKLRSVKHQDTMVKKLELCLKNYT